MCFFRAKTPCYGRRHIWTRRAHIWKARFPRTIGDFDFWWRRGSCKLLPGQMCRAKSSNAEGRTKKTMFGTFAQLPYVYNNIVPRGHIWDAIPMARPTLIVGYPRPPHLKVRSGCPKSRSFVLTTPWKVWSKQNFNFLGNSTAMCFCRWSSFPKS